MNLEKLYKRKTLFISIDNATYYIYIMIVLMLGEQTEGESLSSIIHDEMMKISYTNHLRGNIPLYSARDGFKVNTTVEGINLATEMILVQN